MFLFYLYQWFVSFFNVSGNSIGIVPDIFLHFLIFVTKRYVIIESSFCKSCHVRLHMVILYVMNNIACIILYYKIDKLCVIQFENVKYIYEIFLAIFPDWNGWRYK